MARHGRIDAARPGRGLSSSRAHKYFSATERLSSQLYANIVLETSGRQLGDDFSSVRKTLARLMAGGRRPPRGVTRRASKLAVHAEEWLLSISGPAVDQSQDPCFAALEIANNQEAAQRVMAERFCLLRGFEGKVSKRGHAEIGSERAYFESGDEFDMIDYRITDRHRDYRTRRAVLHPHHISSAPAPLRQGSGPTADRTPDDLTRDAGERHQRHLDRDVASSSTSTL